MALVFARFSSGLVFSIEEKRLDEVVVIGQGSRPKNVAQVPRTRRELFAADKAQWRHACFADCMSSWEYADDDDEEGKPLQSVHYDFNDVQAQAGHDAIAI